MRKQYQLDQPIQVQYASYMGRLLRGDLGDSYYSRQPVAKALLEHFPATALLAGSIILVAVMIGIPLGMLSGIYLSEYDSGSWLASPVRFIADVLAGVPSIVVGIIGYELVVVPFGDYNGWAGALALAFIMVPIVTRTTEEMLRLVPNSYREASIALGATKATTILQVVRNPGWVLPYAACVLVTVGMLIHFGMNLGSFLNQTKTPKPTNARIFL